MGSTPTRRTAMVTLGGLASTVAAAAIAPAVAQAPPGGPLAGGPLASGAASGPFATQPWGSEGRILAPGYVIERVAFRSQGLDIVGNVFVPASAGRKPAIAVIGPVGFVKEQAPIQYASRLVREGYATLVFDPRFHGESAGEPRRHESGTAKVEDLRAAVDYLLSRSDVDSARVHLLGVCQGVNWTIEAAIADARVRSIGLVAGHYLTPDVAVMYLGSPENVAARIKRGQEAEARFRATGQVDYINVVSPSLAQPDPNALLTAPPIHMFYIRWADRSPFLAHRGLWENRLTAMSEAAIWGHRIDQAITSLKTPTLMIHADRAASGLDVPRRLFESIATSRKELVWLGGQSQLQFYEDPLTIEQVIPSVAGFFAKA